MGTDTQVDLYNSFSFQTFRKKQKFFPLGRLKCLLLSISPYVSHSLRRTRRNGTADCMLCSAGDRLRWLKGENWSLAVKLPALLEFWGLDCSPLLLFSPCFLCWIWINGHSGAFLYLLPLFLLIKEDTEAHCGGPLTWFVSPGHEGHWWGVSCHPHWRWQTQTVDTESHGNSRIEKRARERSSHPGQQL